MKHFLSLLLLCSFFSFTALSQTTKSSIAGRVTDPEGGVLQGVELKLQPGDSSVTSNDRGEYTITEVAPGDYSLTASYVGFATFTANVSLIAGQVTHTDVVLIVAARNEKIMVRAEGGYGEAEAINHQRTADNIVQVLPSVVIGSLPNANVGDAIGRLPSITLDRDAGEARYVQVRGTEPRLNNVTINGVTLPSPEGTVRQVKLDDIPASLFDSIEVHKTLAANQDADAIGGTVNLKTKTAGDVPTVMLGGMGGYTPIEGGRNMNQFTSTVGKRFGTSKRFGVLLDGSYDSNGRGIDDIEPSATAYQNGGAIVPAYSSLSLRSYQYDRTRYGIAGETDYKLGEDSDIYLRGIYSNFKEIFHKWQYTLKDSVASDGTITGAPPTVQSANFRPDFAIGSLQAGGKHVFAHSWMAWDLAVSRSNALDTIANPRTDFQPIGALKTLTSCKYDPAATTNPYEPQFDPSCTASGSPVYDPTLYSMKDYITAHSKTAQLNLQGSASMARNYHMGSHFSTFEFGARVRNAHKYQNALVQTFLPVAGTAPLMSAFLSSYTNDDYYDGSYKFGPYTDYGKIAAYFSSSPAAFTMNPGATHLGSDPNNYNLIERISAGYLMNTVNLGRFRLQTGVRFEGTQTDVHGNYVVTDATGAWSSTTAKETKNSYLDAMPSIQLRYGLTKDSVLRAVYGRGIARPNPYDLVPYITQNQQNNTIGIGNPSLKPEYANNYDLFYEHYLNPLGVIEAGFFYKDLHNPIYQFQTPITSGDFAGYLQTQMANGTRSHIMGVEISYRQYLTFLPGTLRGLGIAANYSHTTSQAGSLPLRSDRPTVQRQIPNAWNISPTYDRGRISIRLGMSYNGPGIYAYKFKDLNPDGTQVATLPIGGIKGPGGDQYYYPHFQVDAQGSVRIAKGLSAIVSGLNLTNEVFGYYNGSPQFVVQREFYKPTISAGLRWTLNGER